MNKITIIIHDNNDLEFDIKHDDLQSLKEIKSNIKRVENAVDKAIETREMGILEENS